MINNLPESAFGTIKIDTPFKKAYYFGYDCEYCKRSMSGVQFPQGGPIRTSDDGPFFCTFMCAINYRKGIPHVSE